MLGKILKSLFGRKIATADETRQSPPRPIQEKVSDVSVPVRQSDSGNVEVANQPAYLDLLSKFTIGNSIESFQGQSHWQSVLRTHPSNAIRSLVRDGFLEKADLITALTCKFGAPQLKTLAKEKGVSSSGRKDQIAERLVKTNADAVTKLLTGFEAFSCTEKGLAIVRDFEARSRNAKKQAETAAIEALKSNRLKDACRVVAAFEATQVSPWGIGIDWSNYDDSYDLAVLTYVYSLTPKRLERLSDERLLELRVAAAMTHLWGEKSPVSWLSELDLEELGLCSDDAALLLLARAQFHQKLVSMKGCGIKKVIIIGNPLDAVCAECKKQNRQIYQINEVPELPLDSCTCEYGHMLSIAAQL